MLPATPGNWRDVLRGQSLRALSASARAADLMVGFPLAVLCRDQG